MVLNGSMNFKNTVIVLNLWFHSCLALWLTSFLIFTGTSAGNAGGRLCSLHQPVPRLRAAAADGSQVFIFLPSRNHGRVPRWGTFSPSSYCIMNWTVFTFRCSRLWSLMWNVCVWSEMSRARNELQRTPILMDLYHEMEATFVKPSTGIWALPILTPSLKHAVKQGILMDMWLPNAAQSRKKNSSFTRRWLKPTSPVWN